LKELFKRKAKNNLSRPDLDELVDQRLKNSIDILEGSQAPIIYKDQKKPSP